MPSRIQENIRRRREAGASREPPAQRQRRVDQPPADVPSVQFAPPQLTLDPLVTELDAVCRRLRETVLSDRERASNISTRDEAHYAALIGLAAERHERELQQLRDERNVASDTATQALRTSEVATARLTESLAEIQRLQGQWEDTTLLRQRYEETPDYRALNEELWGYGFDFAYDEIRRVHPEWDVDFIRQAAYGPGSTDAGPSGAGGADGGVDN